MVYAYIRVSGKTQDIDNQKFEILNFANTKGLRIDKWVSEVISSRKSINERKFSSLLNNLKNGDCLVVTELTRIGRSLFQIMSILNGLMEKEVEVFTVKEKYELGNNIGSKVLAFAFGLAGEIERDLISSRTKEALARKKIEGIKLGRPKGSISKITKLTGKEEVINELLDKKVSLSAISRVVGVHRSTLSSYLRRIKKL